MKLSKFKVALCVVGLASIPVISYAIKKNKEIHFINVSIERAIDKLANHPSFDESLIVEKGLYQAS